MDFEEQSRKDVYMCSTSKANDERSSRPAQHRIVITLVHGTWASSRRSKSWFEDGSSFAKTLRETFKEFELHFVPFKWTGKNSIYARRDGAKELAQKISSNLDQFPDDQHL